jgi:hypothetical protein
MIDDAPYTVELDDSHGYETLTYGCISAGQR